MINKLRKRIFWIIQISLSIIVLGVIILFQVILYKFIGGIINEVFGYGFVNMEIFVGLWEISGNFWGISTILHPWPPE